MENETPITLPAEVAEIAKNVSAEKTTEVQSVLNSVFSGVQKMKAQLDTVIVSDHTDKVNMKLANTIRLGVRQQRLNAEKVFDLKRAEVQQQMSAFKTEDALWLKAKQTMQILTKEIEENARWKEEAAERFDAEQKELKVQQRIALATQHSQNVQRTDIEFMSDEAFETFVSALKKENEDRIAAEKKAEEERIKKEKTEAEERERVAKENERLKAEAAEREKQLNEERERAAAEKRAIEERARKEREAAEAKAKAEKEAAEAAIKAERERAEKAAAELKAKQEAEAAEKKAAEAKEEAERKAKAAAEKKAAAAPDKVKLEALAVAIETVSLPEVKSEEAAKIIADVKKLLAKTATFIREKTTEI